MKKNNYILRTPEEADAFSGDTEDLFPIPWKNLPIELKKILPEFYLENLLILDKEDVFTEKTFVYIQTLTSRHDDVLDDCLTFESNGNVIAILKEDLE